MFMTLGQISLKTEPREGDAYWFLVTDCMTAYDPNYNPCDRPTTHWPRSGPTWSVQLSQFIIWTITYWRMIQYDLSLQRSRSYTGCRSSTVSPSKLLLSCIRLSTVDARRTCLTLSCLLRPTRMYANFAPALLGPLPSNEAGRSSEGVPSQWPAPTHGTVFPPPSVPSTPTQPSVVRSRHICSA